MGFVVGLPHTLKGWDTTWCGGLILQNDTLYTLQGYFGVGRIATLFIIEVSRYHGLPTPITSGCDT